METVAQYIGGREERKAVRKGEEDVCQGEGEGENTETRLELG